jgi:uncharacterized protein (UPF0212 family)
MDFPHYMCPDCFVVMEAADEGQTEYCPRCGKAMEEAFVTEDT